MSFQNNSNSIKSNYSYTQFKDDLISLYDDIINFDLKQRILYSIHWPWVHDAIRDYYIEKMEEKETDLFETNPLIVDTDVFIKNKKEMSKLKKKHNKSNKEEPEVGIPKRRLMPYGFYVYASITYHIYGVLQSILLIIIFDCPGIIDIHYNCYLLGRISLNKYVVRFMPYVQILSNVLALAYRYWITIHLKVLRMDTLLFVITKEEDIKNQLETDFNEHNIEENWPIQKPIDNYLRDILYLEVEVYDKTTRHYLRPNSKQYFLRPNRTLTAHKHIVHVMNTIWYFSLLAYWVIFIPVQPFIVDAALWDVNYLNNYPTCSPDIEELHRKGQLSRWSLTLSLIPLNHRLLAGTFDVINNCILWQENLAALIFPSALVMLLAEDLILYWKSIRHKLDCLLNKMIYYTEKGLLLDYGPNSMKHLDSIMSFHQRTNSYRHVYDLTLQNSKKIDRELNDEAFLIQRQIIDFFSLLKAYDKYVSCIATYMYTLVVFAFIFCSYFAISSDNIQILTFFRAIQVFAMCTLSIPTFGILRLRGFTKTAYPILNKIMAHERNPRRQLYWKQILDFYTNKPAYCFTILHGHPLDWMTYLNVVASSFSCLIIFETYVRHRFTTTIN